ncbi:MAPEG family protein [Colwellia echini]|uniref:MAPEG family protein n=1 Tax=Colwellia echini TaxID=1982103 RepID=A0ABY3MW60_9GAMM|nr:MAPEG family protein [Colwellia echini]TYK65287.1 MAPEG family protein [Colwellia echini]
MKLSVKQKGVIKGMATAMMLVAVIISASIYFDPFSTSFVGYIKGEGGSSIESRFVMFGFSLILPTLTIIVSIGRLAKFRFLSAEDIDGSGLTKGSKQAILLQSILQNTLEQFVIAVAVYSAWCLLMPITWLSAIPFCSLLFVIGRVLFFKGYKDGAASRALGFALTFYSTALLFLILIIYQLLKVLS